MDSVQVNESSPEHNHNNGITADEIALYDRQIRVWGLEAQNRIRSANVLLVGLKALGTEIAKNLILNGIGSITIVDHETVTEDDLGAQYFLRDSDVGSNRVRAALPRLQELNPRVKVIADIENITTKSPDFYQNFGIIIATDLSFHILSDINDATRKVERPFYASSSHGFYGFIFADLIDHEYLIEREQFGKSTLIASETPTRSVINVTKRTENGKHIELITKREKYVSLQVANNSPLPEDLLQNRRRLKGITPLLPAFRALWKVEGPTGRLPTHSREDLIAFTTLATESREELQLPNDTLKAEFLRSFLQNVGSEISPTAAFIGGKISEDVINVLGKRQQPIQNMVFFDGDTFQSSIYSFCPKATNNEPSETHYTAVEID